MEKHDTSSGRSSISSIFFFFLFIFFFFFSFSFLFLFSFFYSSWTASNDQRINKTTFQHMIKRVVTFLRGRVDDWREKRAKKRREKNVLFVSLCQHHQNGWEWCQKIAHSWVYKGVSPLGATEKEKKVEKRGKQRERKIGENSKLRIKRKEESDKMSIQFVCHVLRQEGGTSKLQKKWL